MTGRTGLPVKNQIVRRYSDREEFVSYGTLIAIAHNDGRIELDEDHWNYSQTTSKYRSKFLGESTAVTQKKIADGTYVLRDLN